MTALAPTTDKPRFPRALAITVAAELCHILKPFCSRLIVAGSLRRRKQSVGDVEILYISKLKPLPQLQQADFLAATDVRQLVLADACINAMAGYYRDESGEATRAADHIITQRRTVQGSITWGPKNKLARHVATGIPVDFFRATEENWFNYLVCRTGSAESNTRIAAAYQAKGCKWNPYGPGYTDQFGVISHNPCEQAVFLNAGLPYLEPWQR